MPKVQLNDLSSLANETSVIATINANNAAIEEGFNNTVSRDGTSPNTLEDDINMNSHRIYNVPLTPFSNADVATKYYVDYIAGLSSDAAPTNPGDAVIDGDLHVTGSADIDVNLNVDGTAVIDDSLSVENGTFLVSNDKIHFTPAGNAGLELGRTDNVASTPYIDFHSGTDGTNDYDARVIVSGGTASDGAAAIGVIAASFNPVSNDGVPLGTSSLSWADLFLASGGVINFANGNATLTHSTGLITSSVPFSVGTSNAITAGTIELGAASDTTLSRASAGNVNIEGNLVYRAGGTDVPVTDGGTGASTAQAAQTNLITPLTQVTAATGDFIPVADVSDSNNGKKVLASTIGTGKQTIWIPAGAMKVRVTSGAGSTDYDSGSNDITITTLAFDTTTQEYAHFHVAFPKGWDEGTVTFIPYWTNTGGSSTQTVRWTLAGAAISNDDSLNATMGTAQNSDDTWLAQNDLHIGPESSAITIGGTPAEGDLVVFQISRDVANDNMSGDALLIGIKLLFTTNANTDD